ncbi:MAG: Dabb family protein [Acidobacteria bacterium]|nr:Dabb family protein [Acidobacteriota bacterium]
MIAHVVLFSPRAGLGSAERDALVAAFETALRDIPSIRHARLGRRVTTGRQYEQRMSVDYQYAAVLEFDDLEGLQAYFAHPAHEQLASRFLTASERALMYDFEWTEGVPRPRD